MKFDFVSTTHGLKARVTLLVLALWILPAQLLADDVKLNWLDSKPPAVQENVSWGVPWPKGTVKKNESFVLKTADGKAIPMQAWPLAYWPDGSIKWSGHSIAATPDMAGPLVISPGPASSSPVQLSAKEDATGIDIDTGALKARILKQGSNLFESLTIGDRQVATNANLVAKLEDRSNYAKDGTLREISFASKVSKVTLEQSGPLRVAVKIEGAHASADRSILPFVVRFYFNAGSQSIRIVHSFIYDGDQYKDFIKELGIAFTVPFKEELHNRHARFAGDETGVWCQPVRLLPGYRNALSPEQYAAHLAGKRMPNLDQFPNRTAAESVAVYNDMKLTQLGPDSFSIDKRTTDKSSWLHVTNGNRSLGLAVLADVSGGIAVGMKDFWQKYPASLEINNAATDAGQIKVDFWSDEASAMDLRTYDEVPHGLTTNYEDWKPGWGTATGIAHTSELTLWAFSAIPEDADLVNMAKLAAAPPLLVATPEYYHSIPAFGRWSLPDRSTPTLKWVEDQLEQLYTFYRDQVEERHWYGFWDFGDIMHNYDAGRHDWRYDVGGWAWANTELMPDMFLWETFLRTGKPDAFRMAEAMTRHTSETDAYHIGPFAPMGTRHNVNHWGDGAKQPRASHAMLKRYMYYLTGGDERLGDLMREQLDADLTYTHLQRYNGSHYSLTPDGKPELERNASGPAPRPEQLAAEAPAIRAARLALTSNQTYSDGKPMEGRYANANFGLDWICYSVNWMTEWERTGDSVWRDRVMAGMKTIVSRANGGPLGTNYFDIIFGGPEILFEEQEMFDYPEFWEGLCKVFEAVGTSTGNEMTAPRGAAYAAWFRKSQDWGNLAWDDLVGDAVIGANPTIPQPALVSGPEVVHPVHDPVFLGRTAGWQLHGVASIQWALNAIETLEFAKPYLAKWESARQQNGGSYVDPRAGSRGRAGGGGRGGNRGAARGAATTPANN